MNFEFVSNAFAQAATETARKPAPIWPMLLGLFAIFYFFMIRPQQKKQKDSQNMLFTLTKGDKVYTIGGIVGTVVGIKEKKDAKAESDVIVLKVADTTKIEVLRKSIGEIVPTQSEAVAKS